MSTVKWRGPVFRRRKIGALIGLERTTPWRLATFPNISSSTSINVGTHRCLYLTTFILEATVT